MSFYVLKYFTDFVENISISKAINLPNKSTNLLSLIPTGIEQGIAVICLRFYLHVVKSRQAQQMYINV